MRCSWILAPLVMLAACGGDAVDVLDDPARTRTVTLTVSVTQDRDPAGAPVVLSGYGTVDVGWFAVVVLDTGTEGVGTDCASAEAAARTIADRIGSDLDECREVTRARSYAAEKLDLVVGDDGTVELPLLPDLDYEVGSFVEIVPGDDGCHWTAATAIAADATAVALHLDSDSCV